MLSNHPTLVAAPCGALLAALSLSAFSSAPGATGAPGDPLVFHPAEGAKVERTYTWTETMGTTQVAFTQDGEEAQDAPLVKSKVERVRTLGVIDQYVRSAPGQPLEFVRRYDDTTEETEGQLEIDGGAGVAELALSSAGTSELEGVGVRFVWDVEDSTWTKSYADDYEGMEELLEPLEMTNDFIALLPPVGRDVAIDEEWDVEVSALAAVLKPGGGLPLVIESDLAAIDAVLDPALLPGVLDTLVGETEGDITARLVSHEDGRATIAIAIDVQVTSDQIDTIMPTLEAAMPDGVVADLTRADYETRLKGKGELVWDTTAGRAASFQVDCEVSVELELAVDADSAGQVATFVLNETREGSLALTVE